MPEDEQVSMSILASEFLVGHGKEEMPETGMVFDVTWSVTSGPRVLTFVSIVTSSAVEFCRAFSYLGCSENCKAVSV